MALRASISFGSLRWLQRMRSMPSDCIRRQMAGASGSQHQTLTAPTSMSTAGTLFRFWASVLKRPICCA